MKFNELKTEADFLGKIQESNESRDKHVQSNENSFLRNWRYCLL